MSFYLDPVFVHVHVFAAQHKLFWLCCLHISLLRKMGFFIMLGGPWVTFGAFGGSLEGPASIFKRLRMLSGGPLAHHFQKYVLWATCFSSYVHGIVPGRSINNFWVPPGSESIEIHTM